MTGHPHIGSSLDEVLRQDGTLGEVEARALERVIARQLSHEMKRRKLSKTALASRMGTSRSQLDRLLDPDSGAMTLEALVRAAHAVGHSVRLELVPE
jgi:antitoxin HicB